MNLKHIRKYRKKEYTEIYLFGDLCFWFLEKHPEQINRLEKILFLMQHESLSTYEIPLLVYDVYIDGDKIYLKRLSELLRLKEPDTVNDSYRIHEKAKPYQYDEMMKKYEKLKEYELNEEIERLIKSHALNKEYFRFNSPSRKKEMSR